MERVNLRFRRTPQHTLHYTLQHTFCNTHCHILHHTLLWQPRIGQTSVSTTNIQTCKLSRLSPTEKGGKKDSIMRGEVSIRETIGDTLTLAKLKKRNKFRITRGK